MTTIQTLAQTVLDAFETATRDNGATFYKLRDGSPEWMTDLCHDAHGDMMPDDWRYAFIRDALISLADADENLSVDDLRDQISEWADSDTDVYYGPLAQWLATNVTRAGYVDEAIENGGYPHERGIMAALMAGQCAEREEVYQTILQGLEERASDDEAV